MSLDPREVLDQLLTEMGVKYVKLVGKTKISIDGVEYSKKSFADKLDAEILSRKSFFEAMTYARQPDLLLSYMQDKYSFKTNVVTDTIRQGVRVLEDGSVAIGEFNYYLDIRSSDDSNYKIISYNPIDRKIGSFSASIDLKINGFPQKEFPTLPVAYTIFDPRVKESVKIGMLPDGRKCRILNTYDTPVWHSHLEDLEGVAKTDLPPLFKKLVDHLFKEGSEDQKFFFHWLYMSLFERSMTYLVLCGLPGIGKNTLKSVMRALHGHANSVDGKRSTIEDKFNSQLDKATLVWFDELSYTMSNESFLKEIQNSTISIERKGVDASSHTTIFCSMVISNNRPRDNYIAYDARKFAPIEMSNKRLEESMSTEEINQLILKVDNPEKESYDPQFIIDIARWVKKYGYVKKWHNCEYRGKMFWSLANSTAPAWQRIAAEFILSKNKPSQVIDRLNPGVYKWSEVLKVLLKNPGFRRWQPDTSNAEYFFNIFRDFEGNQCFKTRQIDDEENFTGDFYIFNLKDPELTNNLKKGAEDLSSKSFEDSLLLKSEKDSIASAPLTSMKEDEDDEYLDF